ncbi:MAG TPA: MFS transporter [Candidatus Dormibacteraeota bacterium]|nr:MFS transporter [Candidatus Dormibacteraeota bacterium]
MIQARLGLTGVPRAAWVLLGGNVFDNFGYGMFFAILPLFIEGRGGNPGLVGIIGAAAMAGNLAVQAPAGWLADRFSRRAIVVASLGAYGLCFFLYLLPLPVWTLIGVRFAHAAVGGFYLPAARALLADLTPRHLRATAFGHWQGSGMGGFLVGPTVGGGLAVLFGFPIVFVAAALAGLVGAAFLTRLPSRVEVEAETGEEAAGTPVLGRLVLLLLPAMLVSLAWFYASGAYNAMWVLYMTALGASPLVAGLSLTFYSLPIVLLSGAGGRLADRYGIRVLTLGTLLGTGVFALFYALTRSIPVVMGLGFAEALFTVGGMPAIYAEISRAVPSSQQGRAQGIFGSFTIGVQALGSLAGGFLFSYWIVLPFMSIAAACLAGIFGIPFLGRRRVPDPVAAC